MSGILSLHFFASGGGAVPAAALYVVLSRVKTHNAFLLMETVMERHQKYFQPGGLLLEDERRLKEFHKDTMRRYEIA